MNGLPPTTKMETETQFVFNFLFFRFFFASPLMLYEGNKFLNTWWKRNEMKMKTKKKTNDAIIPDPLDAILMWIWDKIQPFVVFGRFFFFFNFFICHGLFSQMEEVGKTSVYGWVKRKWSAKKSVFFFGQKCCRQKRK